MRAAKQASLPPPREQLLLPGLSVVLSAQEGRLCADASCPSVAGMPAGAWMPPPRGLLLPVALAPGLPEAAALLLALGLPQGLHRAILLLCEPIAKAAPSALEGLTLHVIRLALPPLLPAVLAFAAACLLL